MLLEGQTVEIQGHLTGDSRACPGCGQSSQAIHSHYCRRLRDIPISTWHVQLVIRIRRFRCQNRECTRQTFAESLADLAPAYARRSSRLTTALRAVGLVVGAQAGSRLAGQLRMKTSPTTLLRVLRQTPLPAIVTPRVLGIDDWGGARKVVM